MDKEFDVLKQLTEYDRALARSDLNEPSDSEQVKKEIEKIRNWVLKQTYMKSRVDEDFLLQFLRACKFDIGKTKDMIKNFWLHRLETIEYFIARNLNEDSVLLEIADTAFIIPLMEPDSQGRLVLIERIAGWNPQKHEYNDLMKYILICHDVLCENPRVQINGVVTIMDCTSFSASQISECTPYRMQQTTKILQNTYPFRYKTLNYYNYPRIFDAFFPSFKILLRNKIQDRLIMHGSDLNSLQKVIPKSILPLEYGGTAGTLQEINTKWVNHVLSRRDMLMDMNNYGIIDASKVPNTVEITETSSSVPK